MRGGQRDSDVVAAARAHVVVFREARRRVHRFFQKVDPRLDIVDLLEVSRESHVAPVDLFDFILALPLLRAPQVLGNVRQLLRVDLPRRVVVVIFAAAAVREIKQVNVRVDLAPDERCDTRALH